MGTSLTLISMVQHRASPTYQNDFYFYFRMLSLRGCLLSCLVLSLSSLLLCQSSPLQRVPASLSSLQGYVNSPDFSSLRSKKPFCNAFTGCGRKRSDPDMAENQLMDLLAERIQGIRDEVGRLSLGKTSHYNT